METEEERESYESFLACRGITREQHAEELAAFAKAMGRITEQVCDSLRPLQVALEKFGREFIRIYCDGVSPKIVLQIEQSGRQNKA